MLLHTAEQLEVAKGHNEQLEAAVQAYRRQELTSTLWIPDLCDVSFALRSSQLMLLGGLRMPRASKPGAQRGSGLSPGVAVLRQFGEPEVSSTPPPPPHTHTHWSSIVGRASRSRHAH